jgi:hypothetical protein
LHIFPDGKRVTRVIPFIGGDLAVSENTSADWRSFFIGFTDHWGNVYVLPSHRSKEPDPFVIGKWVLDQHQHYGFHSGTFDGQHFQKWFGRIIEFLRKQHGYERLKVYQEPRSEQKEQVISATLAPFINGNRLFFLGSPEEFNNVMQELMFLGYFDTDDDADGLTYLCANLKYPSYVDFDMMSPVATSVEDEWYDQIPEDKRWEFA